MENESKALIIAGAILLAILLISLGIMIFQQAQDTVSSSGMSKAEVQTFNNTYTKYEGKQRGVMIKSLIQEVLANNNATEDESQKIKMTLPGQAANNYQPTTTGIENNTYYDVELSYEGAGGRIDSITVKETGTTTGP